MNGVKRLTEFYKNNKGRNFTVSEISEACSDFFAASAGVMFCLLPVSVFAYLQAANSWKLLTTFPVFTGVFNGFAVLSGVIAAAMYFFNSRKTSLKNVLSDNIPSLIFLALCLWMLISTAANGFTENALKGGEYRNESLFTFFIYFLVYFFCSSLIKKERLKKAPVYTLLACSWVAGIASLVHRFIKPLVSMEEIDSGRISFVFHQFNHYGYFLTIAITLSAALFVLGKGVKQKIFTALTFCFNSVLLTVNATFGCFLAVCAALVFLAGVAAVTEKRFNAAWLAPFILFLIISYATGRFFNSFFTDLAGLFNDIKMIIGNNTGGSSGPALIGGDSAESVRTAGDAGTGRWSLWTSTVGYIKERPLFGHGIEGIGRRLEEETGYSDRPHNEFLQYAMFFGIPAAVIYVSGVMSVFVKAFCRRAKLDSTSSACLVAAFAYLVSSFFGNTMYYTAPLFFIFLGIGSSVPSESKNRL